MLMLSPPIVGETSGRAVSKADVVIGIFILRLSHREAGVERLRGASDEFSRVGDQPCDGFGDVCIRPTSPRLAAV
jgi:hypothetical protein